MVRPLLPLRTWVAQYVTTATHEPIYRFDLVEARYEADARLAAKFARQAGEAFVSLTPAPVKERN